MSVTILEQDPHPHLQNSIPGMHVSDNIGHAKDAMRVGATWKIARSGE